MGSDIIPSNRKQTSMFHSLPFELQLKVYEILGEDRRSLCSFSQTCREVREGSVEVIFRDMPDIRDPMWLEPFRTSSLNTPHPYLEHLSKLTMYSYDEPTCESIIESNRPFLPQSYPSLCLPNLDSLTLYFKQSSGMDRVGYDYLRPFRSLLPLMNPKELTIGLKDDPDRFFLWLPHDQWEICTKTWTRLEAVNQMDGTMICRSDAKNSIESLTEYRSVLDHSTILATGRKVALRFPMYIHSAQTMSSEMVNEPTDIMTKLLTVWNSSLFTLPHCVTIEFLFQSQKLISQARTYWTQVPTDGLKCTVSFGLSDGIGR